MRLADSLEEQALLETVLEDSKPQLPPAARRLHYLLATPFRYRPHHGSRFRAALDLTRAPLARERALWTHRTSYADTQVLAAAARTAQLQIIRYESVRDPEQAACAAVLDPAVFGRGKPRAQESWFIAASRQRVRCARDERGGATWEFTSAQLLGGTPER